MRRRDRVLVVVAWLAFVVMAAIYGPSVAADPGSAGHRHMAQTKPATPAPKAPAPKVGASTAKVAKKSPAAEYTPTVRFRLRTELADGKMAFVGVGGAIEGVVNPPLRVAEGDVVQVTLINNDNVEHDVVFPEFDAGTDKVARKGASSVTVFRADKSGEFAYFCSLPGHRQAGMEGKLTVGGPLQPFKAGAGLIAVEGATPIIPMKLKIHSMSIVDRRRFPAPFRGDVELVIGDPIRFDADMDHATATTQLEAAVAAL